MSTVVINHSDLFGLRQVKLQENYTELSFRTPSLYNVVRHPIMLGFLMPFWATPQMTLGHLLFAAVMTVYIIITTLLEERDLINVHGDAYTGYRRRVPMLIPLPEK